MSRRAPNPAAERAAQNQAAIKSLLKLEANKTCADCKRNKHPRWASWNLGIFICIRCSGIHRGMGTHISRVKSVDLDSWTDEQLQSVVKWGNARANKYWEAKLAAGHAPSEGKIENFIRTKYELKRWVMEGPMPDPSTLDDDDDDDDNNNNNNNNNNIMAGSTEKQAARKTSVGQRHPGPGPAAPALDLIGSVDPLPQQRTGPPAAKIPAKAEPAPPKATGTKDSLLGLDFFGSGSAPQRPASTTGVNAGGPSRPDLKQSILSLYASAPKSQPPPQQQQHQHQHQGGFGGMGHHQHPGSVGGGGGGLNDAFGNLSMGSPVSPGKPPAPADPFASLGSTARTSSSSQSRNSFGGLSGGSFFDAKPTAHQHQHQSRPSNSSFGAFSSPPQASAKPSSAMNDLFDFSSPTTTTTTPGSAFQPASQTSPSAQTSSAFHLSSPPAHTAAPISTTTTATATASTTTSALGGANLSGADVWGGGSDWTLGTGSAARTTTTVNSSSSSVPPAKKAELPKTSGMGWGSSGGAFAATPIVPGSTGGFNPAPKVAADEEFGGWTSSAGPSSGVTATTTKAFGEDGNDLFGNVWQ